MLEIRTDISSLTKDQREQLAGFILTFDMPRQLPLDCNSPKPVATTININGASVPVVLSNNIPTITFGDTISASPSPEAVFAPDSAVTEYLKAAEGAFLIAQDVVAEIAAAVPPPPPLSVISPAGPHLLIGSVAVDKSGLPWDERIHSSSKNLTAEGLWRKKRGVSEAALVLTESELRRIPLDTPGSPFIAVPPPPPLSLESPVAAPPPPAISSEGKAMYIKLIGDTTAAVGAKKATQEDFKSIALAHDVPSIPLLIQHLDKIQAVADDCYALIASRG